MDPAVDPTSSDPQFLSSVKEALTCGLLGVILSTGFVQSRLSALR